MSDTDFDYGGEVAVTVSKFKQPDEGTRNARLYGVLRVGTFQETFDGKLKDPAPQGIAIFYLLGSKDKTDDGEPMFFTKPFPFKKGDKSFLHSKLIPAFGGMSKHTGFGSMINNLFSLTLKGGKDKNEDGTPKYMNFGAMAAIADDTLEDIQDLPKYAGLDTQVGFLKENELTKEALEILHPTREFAGIVMKTQEFVAGTHPSQEVIQAVYDADPERYTFKAKDTDKPKAGDEGESGAGTLPVAQEALGTEQEF